MLLPIPNSRKWMRVEIRVIEHRWFDDLGEFYTYTIKNGEIVEIIEEEELVEDIMKSVKHWLDDGHSVEQLREEIAIAYGIPERYIDGILERVKVELGLIEVANMLIEPDFRVE